MGVSKNRAHTKKDRVDIGKSRSVILSPEISAGVMVIIISREITVNIAVSNSFLLKL